MIIYIIGIGFTGLFISMADSVIPGKVPPMSMGESLLHAFTWPLFWCMGLMVFIEHITEKKGS